MAINKTNGLGDTVSILAHCISDDTFLLCVDGSNEYHLPFSKVNENNSVCKQLNQDIFEIFSSNIPMENIFRVYKFWVPNFNCQVHNYLFNIKIEGEQKKKSKLTSGRFRGKITWISDADIYKIFSSRLFRSPEIFEAIMSVKNKSYQIPDAFKCEGISCIGVFMEMSENIVNLSNNHYDQLLEAASLIKQLQISLYKEFVSLCFPSFFMGPQTFIKFFSGFGWAISELSDMFRAADIQNRNGVSFRELLYLIAATEQQVTATGGAVGDIRNRYIFRFYDKDSDGLLRSDELKTVFSHIRKATKSAMDNTVIMKDISDFYKSIAITEGTPVTVFVFSKAIADGKLRNCSTIFHSPISLSSYLKEISDKEIRQNVAELRRSKLKSNSLTSEYDKLNQRIGFNFPSSQPGSAFKYEIGYHSVKIFTAGIINIDKVNTLDCVSPSSTQRPVLDDIKRKVSIDQFNQESITNELIKSLRYMNIVNKQKQGVKKIATPGSFTWGNIDPNLFARRLMNVCKMATELFKKEPRLVYMPSPTYILGDLHGNFSDLLHFESILWHVGPCLCPSSILFLGDYVDRGSSSIEVVTYLFSYKVQNPSKIKMIRGNHEIREVQKMFTFYNECMTKFGDKMGLDVWTAINLVFDYMPLAAVVDNSLFCCHGGIPPPWLCPVVSCINDIPSPLNQPDEQSPLAWDIMWNDPLRIKQATEAVMLELSTNDGFATNKRRGTAHIFSPEALDKFLKSNGFSHLIRAHEVSPAGFSILQKGKLLTVFSSSKYCGGNNDAACILADQGRLRILRMDAD